MLNDLLGTETETIDRLFLELSQFTKARTKREVQLNELLFSVERKFPGETRFETALRYIREAERAANSGITSAAVPNTELTGRVTGPDRKETAECAPVERRCYAGKP